jgi:hypothetical protein
MPFMQPTNQYDTANKFNNIKLSEFVAEENISEQCCVGI